MVNLLPRATRVVLGIYSLAEAPARADACAAKSSRQIGGILKHSGECIMFCEGAIESLTVAQKQLTPWCAVQVRDLP